jgi:hypothetical protein
MPEVMGMQDRPGNGRVQVRPSQVTDALRYFRPRSPAPAVTAAPSYAWSLAAGAVVRV